MEKCHVLMQQILQLEAHPRVPLLCYLLLLCFYIDKAGGSAPVFYNKCHGGVMEWGFTAVTLQRDSLNPKLTVYLNKQAGKR